MGTKALLRRLQKEEGRGQQTVRKRGFEQWEKEATNYGKEGCKQRGKRAAKGKKVGSEQRRKGKQKRIKQ